MDYFKGAFEVFKIGFPTLCVGKWYNFIVSQKCIGLDDMYSD